MNVQRTVQLQFIEHFHSVTRRVSHGEAEPVHALLTQEHPMPSGFCRQIERSLPNGTVFRCHALAGSTANGGVNYRESFFAQQLHMAPRTVSSVVGQYQGTGALFTAVYARYDLLVLWYPLNGTVQRLSNALATGVPVIVKKAQPYVDAFGDHGILMADGLSDLHRMALSLRSRKLRRQVSDHGVAAADKFSRASISVQYKLFVADASRAHSHRHPKCPKLQRSVLGLDY